MAIADGHIRFLWGAVDFDLWYSQSPNYVNPTQFASLGDSAAAGVGIGVRRATLIMARDLVVPSDDEAQMHFDFLNITGGNPDDTWTSGDFTTLEGYLTTWYNAVKPYVPTWMRLHRISWHRVGPGVPLPNPAERILDIVSPIAGTGGTSLPPQTACSITFRTGMRKAWGRTYLPYGSTVTSVGRLDPTNVDTINTATVALGTSAKGSDFHPVVTAPATGGALGIDYIEVDNTVDIVRRRRWKHTTYRKIVAA